ncbi:hypothetical protein GCM10011371_09800 [Novosphingobium marinum]|uniref:Transmembrane protein n=1 Tax=Novosphingobium marinum TaxID=1514948 RepID=A0A7Y9XY02_9SPHN|nr:hypothetical protein [Novosphingobium marinum]NYH95086.1 hypothetical protein [Novosphingobium marinum]GGC24155.1 hypothetical protein GCM10011371_09800 [Novosphingobium marinum]
MKVASAIGRNWFYALLPLWLIASLGFRSTHPWASQPQLGEAITLFDWCIFIPLTFAICYRGMSRRALFLRVLALICGGIWLAGKLVPADAQNLLQTMGAMRWLGLSVVLLFEVAAIVAMLRIVFGATPDPRALTDQGIPPIVARLMIAEAKFWRWLWACLTGK